MMARRKGQSSVCSKCGLYGHNAYGCHVKGQEHDAFERLANDLLIGAGHVVATTGAGGLREAVTERLRLLLPDLESRL